MSLLRIRVYTSIVACPLTLSYLDLEMSASEREDEVVSVMFVHEKRKHKNHKIFDSIALKRSRLYHTGGNPVQ